MFHVEFMFHVIIITTFPPVLSWFIHVDSPEVRAWMPNISSVNIPHLHNEFHTAEFGPRSLIETLDLLQTSPLSSHRQETDVVSNSCRENLVYPCGEWRGQSLAAKIKHRPIIIDFHVPWLKHQTSYCLLQCPPLRSDYVPSGSSYYHGPCSALLSLIYPCGEWWGQSLDAKYQPGK